MITWRRKKDGHVGLCHLRLDTGEGWWGETWGGWHVAARHGAGCTPHARHHHGTAPSPDHRTFRFKSKCGQATVP